MVANGRALHLRQRTSTINGYDTWPYLRYEHNGTAVGSEVNVRRAGNVIVLCGVPDVGALLARLPRGEWGSDELATLANWLTEAGYDLGDDA